MDGEGGGVVIGADADPSDIIGDVVDAVRYGALQLRIHEVVNVDEFGPSLTTPFPAIVLEISHQFLLFRVNRDERFVRRQKPWRAC